MIKKKQQKVNYLNLSEKRIMKNIIIIIKAENYKKKFSNSSSIKYVIFYIIEILYFTTDH